MPFIPHKKSLYDLSLEELKETLKEMKQPAFRAEQIMDWLYKKQITEWDAMLNLPKKLKLALSEKFNLSPSKLVLDKKAGDITDKLLFELEDNNYIETVVIRQPQKGVGQEDSRKTVCVSSQVGCAYGCKFCASGLNGWKRNLSCSEILTQLLHVCKHDPDPESRKVTSFDNLVFMGMGEPLANYDNVIKAINTINAEWGMNFGARRITISTSGLVPEIKKLAEESVQFRLALSLHGATNDVRSQIMPINKRYPLEELIPAVKLFTEKRGRMITLEYILIEKINDDLRQAKELAKIAKELHAHVNLIPYNKVEGLEWVRPSLTRQKAFAKILAEQNVSHTIRKEKGHDIDAACGQLRLRKEKENKEQTKK